MELDSILQQLQNGNISVEHAKSLLTGVFSAVPAYDDLGYAVVDHQRKSRTGASEVIYCAGKTPEQIVGIMRNMLDRGTKNILATRAEPSSYELIKMSIADAEYNSTARIIKVVNEPVEKYERKILVISAGTSDIPVAEEVVETAVFLGCNAERLYDVGVAGLHRLLSKLDVLRDASVIIVVAGMEGALASVVGGLTDKPVIAVPTSVGYGASFNGLAALLAMLNSCASGVGVVNIDNGFGAAMLAYHIVRLIG